MLGAQSWSVPPQEDKTSLSYTTRCYLKKNTMEVSLYTVQMITTSPKCRTGHRAESESWRESWFFRMKIVYTCSTSLGNPYSIPGYISYIKVLLKPSKKPNKYYFFIWRFLIYGCTNAIRFFPHVCRIRPFFRSTSTQLYCFRLGVPCEIAQCYFPCNNRVPDLFFSMKLP